MYSIVGPRLSYLRKPERQTRRAVLMPITPDRVIEHLDHPDLRAAERGGLTTTNRVLITYRIRDAIRKLLMTILQTDEYGSKKNIHNFDNFCDL